MTQISDIETHERPKLTDDGFKRIAEIAKDNWGLHLEEGKRPLVTARLAKRLATSGAANFSEYIGLIEAGSGAECEHFVSALTTNVTHFFREQHHFDYLTEHVVPALRDQKTVRVWSAGCSTGQEPYSIAGTLTGALPKATDLRILATDVDQEVLRKAEAGTYSRDEIAFPSPALEARVFGSKQSGATCTVKPELRSLVTFRRLNLIQPWPLSGTFDVIFCRNVAIYFDKPTQAKLWERFAGHLNPDGHLFIGHSERVEAPEAIGLRAAGITLYQKSTALDGGRKCP